MTDLVENDFGVHLLSVAGGQCQHEMGCVIPHGTVAPTVLGMECEQLPAHQSLVVCLLVWYNGVEAVEVDYFDVFVVQYSVDIGLVVVLAEV